MIKLSPNYDPAKTTYFCVHNAGGTATDPNASSLYMTDTQLEGAHKDRFGLKSSLGRYQGYNFYIWISKVRPDPHPCRIIIKEYTAFGVWAIVTQGRAIGEETCAQKEPGHTYNFDGEVISTCLSGNYTAGVELPTGFHVDALRALYDEIKAIPGLSIVPENIVPHRLLQTNHTSCFGSGLPDDWAANILTQAPVMQLLQQKLNLLKMLLALLQKNKLGRELGRMLGIGLRGCLQSEVQG